MSKNQIMIEQINGIIQALPERDRSKLPKTLIKYFNDNADSLPNEAIDITKRLEEQELSDETLVMLSYINKILQGEKFFE